RDSRFALEIAHRFAADGYDVRKLVTANDNARSKTGAGSRIGLVEKNRHVELMLGVVVPECMGSGTPHGLDLASELVVGQWVHLDVHRLTRFEVAMIGLSHLGIDLEM